MKIAYVLGQFPSYTETFISNEIHELREAGLEIDILSLTRGSLPVSHVEAVYDCSFFKYRKLLSHISVICQLKLYYFSLLIQLLRHSGFSIQKILKASKDFSSSVFLFEQIRNKDIEHVHAHFMSTPSSVGIILAKFLKVPFSCTGHANDIYTSNQKELVEKINFSKFVVTCTLFNKVYLSALDIKRNKLFHIYHGIHLTKWVKKKRLCVLSEKSTINLLLVARLVAKKGINYLFEAIKSLRDADYNIKCKIIGDGPERSSLEGYIRRNNLEDTISLLGSMTQDRLQEYYLEADIFILPSLIAPDGDRDGLPNVLLEAMAVGIPIVATDVSAIGELIEDEQTGLLIPEKNAPAIAQAIARMIQDHDLYMHISKTGEQRIKQFDIKESTKSLFELFAKD